MSRMMSAVIAGAVAGVVGAGVWAAIAYYANMQSGWVALGIGVLVGVAVAAGAQEERGVNTGVIAVVVSVLAILGGKWAVIEINARQAVEEIAAENAYTQQELMVIIADGVHADWFDQGRSMRWPQGQSVETAVLEEHYPADLWAEAETRWNDMGPDGRQAFRDEMDAELRADVADRVSEVKGEAFKSSFGLMDILFFGLAVFSAFKIGAGVMAND